MHYSKKKACEASVRNKNYNMLYVFYLQCHKNNMLVSIEVILFQKLTFEFPNFDD